VGVFINFSTTTLFPLHFIKVDRKLPCSYLFLVKWGVSYWSSIQRDCILHSIDVTFIAGFFRYRNGMWTTFDSLFSRQISGIVDFRLTIQYACNLIDSVLYNFLFICNVDALLQDKELYSPYCVDTPVHQQIITCEKYLPYVVYFLRFQVRYGHFSFDVLRHYWTRVIESDSLEPDSINGRKVRNMDFT